MPFTNQSDLEAAVLNWIERDDLAARVPDFIALAEAKFNRTLRLQAQIARVTATADVNGEVTLPSDWAESKDISVVTSRGDKQLDVAAYDVLLREREQPGGADSPRVCAIVGTTLMLAPVPPTPAELKLSYYRKIPGLAASPGGVNWLLTRAPDVYLYAACLQAAPYLRDTEMLQVWSAGLEKALEELLEEDRRAKHSGSPLRARSSRSF